MSNKRTFAQIVEQAEELADTEGVGSDSQIKFHRMLVEEGYHGALDLDPNKHMAHGVGRDDAAELVRRYFERRHKRNIYNHRAANIQKAASVARKCIQLGMWPRGGNGEPLATVNELMDIRLKLKKVPEKAKLLKDAVNTLVDYARVQLKRDTLIDAAELEELCYKKVSRERTAEELVKALATACDNLVNGHTPGGAMDNSASVRGARDLLKSRLREIAQEIRDKVV